MQQHVDAAKIAFHLRNHRFHLLLIRDIHQICPAFNAICRGFGRSLVHMRLTAVGQSQRGAIGGKPLYQICAQPSDPAYQYHFVADVE